MTSPSEELAKKIVEKLTAESLLTMEDANKIVAKLAEGKLRSEDWKLAIEKGVEKGKGREQ